MTTVIAKSLFKKTVDAAAPLDVSVDLNPTDLVSYTFPATGGDWVTADGVTYKPNTEAFLKPVATISANSLSDPLSVVDVLLFNDFKESSAGKSQTNAINYLATVALYCNNRWTARDIGLISPDLVKDAGQHYQAKRDMLLDLTATMGSSDGIGLFIGAAWQVYGGTFWQNIDDSGNGRNMQATGQTRFTEHHRIYLNKNEYIRLLTNVNDGGNNTYPGNRTFRIAVQESK